MKYFGIGRRKSAVARVVLDLDHSVFEEIIINKKKNFNYFHNHPNVIDRLRKYLGILEHYQPFTTIITVSGGGYSGQCDAICFALTNIICQIDNGLRSTLKKQGQLTQDARIKERRKYGLKKARKAPQYSKR